jgi:hypothetical protein
MIMESGRVKPDPRKGKISVLDLEVDGLTHFQWTDLASGHVLDDFIVFPEDARFMKAVQSKGRVYLLEFSGQHAFFWMQEPDADKDEERTQQLNNAMGTSALSESSGPPPSVGKTGKTGKTGKGQQRVHSANTNEELAAILSSFARARPLEECKA